MAAKAYLYGRFSTLEQKDGDSYRRQTEKAEAYVAKKGLELETTYFDKGTSAYLGLNATEGALGQFIQAVEAGEIVRGSYLLVENQDRLSRERIPTAVPRFLNLINKGIIIVTLSDEREYSSADMGFIELLTVIMPMQVAHEESKKKSQRLTDVWRHKKKLARESLQPLGKSCPHWLTLSEDGSFFYQNEKVKIVERIFELSASGYGKGRIAALLNGEGIHSFKAGQGSRSGLWQTSSIGKILNSRAVLGEYQPYSRVADTVLGRKIEVPEGELIKGYYPQVISEDLFYKARAALRQRRNTKQTKTGEGFSNLLQGAAICKSCGARMHYVNKGVKPKGGNYLVCSTAKVGGGCNYHGYKYEIAEEIFREALTKLPTLNLIQESSAQTEVRMNRALDEVEGLKGKLETSAELLRESPSRVLAQQVKEIEGLIEHKLVEVESLKMQLAEGGFVSDRTSFLNRLDLASYEGRYKANQLVNGLGITFVLGFCGLSKKEQREFVTQVTKSISGVDAVSERTVSNGLDALNVEAYEVVKDEKILMKFDVTRAGWCLGATSVQAIAVGLTQGIYRGDEALLERDIMSAALHEVGADIESPDFSERMSAFFYKLNLKKG